MRGPIGLHRSNVSRCVQGSQVTKTRVPRDSKNSWGSGRGTARARRVLIWWGDWHGRWHARDRKEAARGLEDWFCFANEARGCKRPKGCRGEARPRRGSSRHGQMKTGEVRARCRQRGSWAGGPSALTLKQCVGLTASSGPN